VASSKKNRNARGTKVESLPIQLQPEKKKKVPPFSEEQRKKKGSIHGNEHLKQVKAVSWGKNGDKREKKNCMFNNQ